MGIETFCNVYSCKFGLSHILLRDSFFALIYILFHPGINLTVSKVMCFERQTICSSTFRAGVPFLVQIRNIMFMFLIQNFRS